MSLFSTPLIDILKKKSKTFSNISSLTDILKSSNASILKNSDEIFIRFFQTNFKYFSKIFLFNCQFLILYHFNDSK